MFAAVLAPAFFVEGITNDTGLALVACLVLVPALVWSMVPTSSLGIQALRSMLLVAPASALIVATGALSSPFRVIVAMFLILAAAMFETRVFRLHEALTLLAVTGAALVDADRDARDVAALAGWLFGWVIVAGAAHYLAQRLRTSNRALKISEQRFRSLFDENPDAVYTTDVDGRFVDANREMCRLSGVAVEDMIGRNFDELVCADAGTDSQRLFEQVLQGSAQSYDTAAVDGEGRRLHLLVTKVPVRVDGVVVGAHAMARDVTELKRLQDELAHQVLHDPLTGLPNRRLLEDRLDQALAERPARNKGASVLIIDLDGFKPVNDQLGHQAGDRVLEQVAARLAACMRPVDTVARLGGDEFAVVLPDTDQHDAGAVAHRLLAALTVEFPVEDTLVSIGASIGGATASPGATSHRELMRMADDAMYEAKAAGKGGYVSGRARARLSPSPAPA